MNANVTQQEALTGAMAELQAIGLQIFSQLPAFGVALCVVIVFAFIARLVKKLIEHMLQSYVDALLLRRLYSQVLAALLFLFGCYVGLRIAGLTQLAITVLGGTGLAGLIFGFAFRDIAENFLASIILSLQRPFQLGDVVEVDGHVGIVERMTVRCTILMNFEGDHIQIPNSTVFKNIIRNLTANANQRSDFIVGIGYDASVPLAQKTALEVIQQHPSVLKTPEPWVLVDSLGASTINVRIYFWIDIRTHNALKVRSAVMRSVVAAFLEAGISMPDEAREIVFPNGIEVTSTSKEVQRVSSPRTENAPHSEKSDEDVSSATEQQAQVSGEGDLRSDVDELKRQAANARTTIDGGNLL